MKLPIKTMRIAAKMLPPGFSAVQIAATHMPAFTSSTATFNTAYTQTIGHIGSSAFFIFARQPCIGEPDHTGQHEI